MFLTGAPFFYLWYIDAMNLLISIIPGVAFACVIFLGIISATQFYIYKKEGYRRSQAISLFCFFSAIFAMEHVFAQSRIISGTALNYFVMISTPALFASLCFYIKALNYFIAFPNWFFKTYKYTTVGLFLFSLAGFPAQYFFDIHLYFDDQNLVAFENYFVDSYSSRAGRPSTFLNIILSTGACLTAFSSIYILRRVLKSSRDVYFIVGLLLTIVAATVENFFLPFTYAFFVPMIFLSNLFEAFRMNTLANQEYMREKEIEFPDYKKSVDNEKYQNSNLSEERISKLSESVTSLLVNEKVFLNPNLHLEDIARKIGIPNYQLSQVISAGLKTTFFELISQYRINYVKKRLDHPETASETIINIAYEAGFNSKSAFNTAFKRQTGMTPSDYRKQKGH